jgi:hypothetical protein
MAQEFIDSSVFYLWNLGNSKQIKESLEVFVDKDR